METLFYESLPSQDKKDLPVGDQRVMQSMLADMYDQVKEQLKLGHVLKGAENLTKHIEERSNGVESCKLTFRPGPDIDKIKVLIGL